MFWAVLFGSISEHEESPLATLMSDFSSSFNTIFSLTDDFLGFVKNLERAFNFLYQKEILFERNMWFFDDNGNGDDVTLHHCHHHCNTDDICSRFVLFTMIITTHYYLNKDNNGAIMI